MRRRSHSLPVNRVAQRAELATGESPVTHISEPIVPDHFMSILRTGIVPGGGGDGITSADGVAGYPEVCVQRMQHTPTHDHLDSAMTNPAMGIIPVTSERPGAPLEKESQRVPLGNTGFSITETSLTLAGKAEAQRRVHTSMLVSAHVPAETEEVHGISERNRDSIAPASMTSIFVPTDMVAPLQRQANKEHLVIPAIQGVARANIENVRFSGTNTTTSISAPDYRPALHTETHRSAKDFHVVRAEKPEYRTRQRSKSIG